MICYIKNFPTAERDDFIFYLAEDIDLKNYIKISKALEKDGGRTIPSISACVFEAFLGALYENGTKIEKIAEFLNKLYSKYIDNLETYLPKFNAKAILQEYTQSKNNKRPEYELISETGHDNSAFKIKVSYEGKQLGLGTGKNKKQAEREAAYQACIELKLLEKNNE